MAGNLATLPRPIHEVEVIVWELARDTANVFLTAHAKQRMRERAITMEQVTAVLRFGNVLQKPRLTKEGDWSYVFEHRLLNKQVLKASVVLEDHAGVDVLTVMWHG